MNVPADNAKHFPDDAELIRLLREVLECDPEAGVLVYKTRPLWMFPNSRIMNSVNARLAGKRAFVAIDTEGYCTSHILGKHYRAHRVIWAMVHGKWPTIIDHINRVRTDNRISNLREVTKAENARNATIKTKTPSGVSGVYWTASNKKWRATIKGDNAQIHLGYFREITDAIAARKAAQDDLGFYPDCGSAS